MADMDQFKRQLMEPVPEPKTPLMAQGWIATALYVMVVPMFIAVSYLNDWRSWFVFVPYMVIFCMHLDATDKHDIAEAYRKGALRRMGPREYYRSFRR